MKKLVLALALTAASSISAFAQAADFASVDTDADGYVTIEEAQAAGLEFTEEDWADADTDGDGMLNEDEYAAATQG